MMLRRLVLLATFATASCARAGEVQVAVAANFSVPMQRIAAAFTATTGHVARVAVGATGKLHAQVQAGAPFEVLLAADDETPRKLVAQGQAVAGTPFTYAIGKLVLWSSSPGVVDAQGAVLASGRFRHIALANPKLAPYGAAALEVLKARGLAETLAPRIVLGETIAQAYQFVATGNAELGFVALSQVNAPGKPIEGSWWLVPASLHGEIRQDAVLLKPGERNPAARALLAFLKTEAARQLIEAYGYTVPGP